jgi:hypothetical protein
MSTNEPVSIGRMSPARSAVFRAARWLSFAFIAWLWFFSADDSAWKAVALVAVLGIVALRSIKWYVARARSERRWRAALDLYAEQEQAKRTSGLSSFAGRVR